MFKEPVTDISSFFIAGINYKKTDASIRGQFSVSGDQYQQIISLAPQYGITGSERNPISILGFTTGQYLNNG